MPFAFIGSTRRPASRDLTDVRCLLLVRNGVSHDARVLRAARVAEQTLSGTALIAGVATAGSHPGPATVEGVQVVRLAARPPGLARLARAFGRHGGDRNGGESASNRAAVGGSRDTRAHGAVAKSGEVAVPGSEGTATHAPQCTLASSRLTAAGRVRRILSGLSFLVQALALARRVRPATVHANDWNTMWSGVAIKLVCGSRLVYDSHELWPDRNGRWEWRPWLIACEALFVRIADQVLTSSPGYADALAERYRVARPRVVRNIPGQAPAAESIRVHARRRELEGPGEAPWIAYVGGLMPGRGLEQAIDALALVPGVRLRAVGPGAAGYRTALRRRAESAGVAERVELRPPVAPMEVPQALAGAAAGVCLIQPVCRSYELCLPNKLFEYAGAGLPVLASDVSILAAVVRDHGLGEVAPADEPQAIAASLERLLEPRGWRLTARRAREFAQAHSWLQEARVLASAYERATAKAAP